MNNLSHEIQLFALRLNRQQRLILFVATMVLFAITTHSPAAGGGISG